MRDIIRLVSTVKKGGRPVATSNSKQP